MTLYQTSRVVLAGVVIGAVVLGVRWFTSVPEGLLSAQSVEYRETVRAFYRGVASLEVGLLQDAQIFFERAAELAPAEPAIRANLAVVHIGFGNRDEAAGELAIARSLASDRSEIAFLEAQLASFEGRFEEAADHFRRAIQLDGDHLQARFALAQELGRDGDDAGGQEAQAQLEAILVREPQNLAVLVQQARLAAQQEDLPRLRVAAEQLSELTDGWSSLAVTQLESLQESIGATELPQAATAAQLLRNVLVRFPPFREDLAVVSVGAELIAEPLLEFLRLPVPPATAAPPDLTLTYETERLGMAPDQTAIVGIFPPDEVGQVSVWAASGQEVRGDGGRLEEGFDFPGGAAATAPSPAGVLALDWNSDYLMDLALAGAGGLRVLLQAQDGSFSDLTPTIPSDVMETDLRGQGIWAADIEMDGDLDIVLGPVDDSPRVLRNNADGTWLPVQPFPDMPGVWAFGWGDLDLDGDPDAVLLDADGTLHLLENRQGGRFEEASVPASVAGSVALAVGDVDVDGRVDLVTLNSNGVVWRSSWDGNEWDSQELARWSQFSGGGMAGSHRLLLADLDNNGALDLLASGESGTQVWLADEQSVLAVFDQVIQAEVFGVGDLTADGRLDLVGLESGIPVRLVGHGSASYGWQQIRPRAHIAAGDQRINSFGVGGEIEVRAGLLVQKQVLTGAPVHFGLGMHEVTDVTRISWPNGVMQADFEFARDQVVVAEQRLKGSCPWLFAHDGDQVSFVTDFLWRSPLGLRINAQDTADVAQTEDRVLIRGDQLAAVDGEYDLRITGELWETHFFDHVSLLVVDHPPDTEVFVDERFAREPVSLTPIVTGPASRVAGAWDDHGSDVTDEIGARDGHYVASFGRGTHQGVTTEHYLELELGSAAETHEAIWLLAYGWGYPTDSSINVALGQGQHPVPRGVALEGLNEHGRWVVLHTDLGFPAGKNKTMVIEVPRLSSGPFPERVRLATNLEVYWDWIGYAPRRDDAPRNIRRLEPAVATLGYRGYSQTDLLGPRGLEVPRYEIANTRPKWRDLTGFHTRFGDVRELLRRVDDRYVIMNAGDELSLRFSAPPPAPGWLRDFVLVGDGWEKDGDFNTTHSQTVGPLPSHDRPSYDPAASVLLEMDPVYLRHREDWLTFHTRFVAPDHFLRGLRRTKP